jgi:hypothetical protein
MAQACRGKGKGVSVVVRPRARPPCTSGKGSPTRKAIRASVGKSGELKVSTSMDPIRRQELVLKRAAMKLARDRAARDAALKSLLSPLDASGGRYVVIPGHEGPPVGPSALDALASFPFDVCGHLSEGRVVPASEWRSVFSDQFVSGKRAYMAWKDQDCCVDALLADLLPVLSELFLGYHWDAYLFDPFGRWIIESHHDGYLTVLEAEQGAASGGTNPTTVTRPA